MIGIEIFLFGLLIVSTLTSLATEALKTMLVEHGVKYHGNTLAGLVALIMSAAVGIAYIILMEIAFSAQVVIYLIALIFMSWICAMIGYDKVVQTISQLKTPKEDDGNE